MSGRNVHCVRVAHVAPATDPPAQEWRHRDCLRSAENYSVAGLFLRGDRRSEYFAKMPTRRIIGDPAAD